MSRSLFCILLGAALAAAPALGTPSPSAGATDPSGSAHTSTRRITALTVSPDGSLWAGTAGGILRRDRRGAWQRFDRLDGLPSHEVRSIELEGATVRARFPQSDAIWDGASWHPQAASAAAPADATVEGALCIISWGETRCAATVSGLRVQRGSGWRDVGMPSGRGSHLSALLPHRGELWAASYGDRLYAWNGRRWRPASPPLPPGAREVTALANGGGWLWLGTAQSGLWKYRSGRAWRVPMPAGPHDHNGQFLTQFGGRLYMSTLEQGLAVSQGGKWWRLGRPVLSSNAPRQMAAFGGSLYLRHGTGQVDRLDGKTWRRDLLRTLPRKQVSALSADGLRLYAAQWGGWSELENGVWTHHLTLPELQGLPITAVLATGTTRWIGTQGRGIAEVDTRTRQVRWHDERSGLTDDWVTALVEQDGTVYAGTFVGGLVRYDGDRWSAVRELAGECVTSVAPIAGGALLVATRRGLWRLAPDGVRRINNQAPWLDPELQALCPAAGGAWVGARTGLFFLPDCLLQPPPAWTR